MVPGIRSLPQSTIFFCLRQPPVTHLWTAQLDTAGGDICRDNFQPVNIHYDLPGIARCATIF